MKWLLKHRWVNEIGKSIIAIIFGLFGYSSWEGGKLASLEIAPADSYKLMIFGILTGIMMMLSVFILTDVGYSIYKMIRGFGSSVSSDVKE